jgi:hypothetical protein
MSFGKFVNMSYLLVNGAGSGEVYVNETVRTPQLQEPVVSDQDLIQDFTRDTTADSVKASGMAAEQPVEEIPAQIVMAPTETAEGDHDSSIYLNTLQAKDLTMPIFHLFLSKKFMFVYTNLFISGGFFDRTGKHGECGAVS